MQIYDVRKLTTSFSFWTTNFKDLPRTTQSANLCINNSCAVDVQTCNGMPVSFSKANIFLSQKFAETTLISPKICFYMPVEIKIYLFQY